MIAFLVDGIIDPGDLDLEAISEAGAVGSSDSDIDEDVVAGAVGAGNFSSSPSSATSQRVNFFGLSSLPRD